MFGLVSEEEQKKCLNNVLHYYHLLYPDNSFRFEEVEFEPKEIAEFKYTYPGIENVTTAGMKRRKIVSALKHGYSTHLVVLKKGEEFILVDGHRRALVAVERKVAWKAYLIVPEKDQEFGIEKTIDGRVKNHLLDK